MNSRDLGVFELEPRERLCPEPQWLDPGGGRSWGRISATERYQRQGPFLLWIDVKQPVHRVVRVAEDHRGR